MFISFFAPLPARLLLICLHLVPTQLPSSSGSLVALCLSTHFAQHQFISDLERKAREMGAQCERVQRALDENDKVRRPLLCFELR